MEISIGADPEVFLLDKQNNWTTAFNKIKGTKYDPYPVEEGAIQVDGTAAEFNIDPCYSSKEFCSRIDKVLNLLKQHSDCEIDENVTRHWGILLENMTDVERQLGCEPDFNAYTLKHNTKPDVDTPFRTAGGHVHVGYTRNIPIDEGFIQFNAEIVKVLDERLGVASLLWDNDSKRRELYGKAGSFRPKHFGVEYRPLSNSWIFKNHTKDFVFKQAIQSTQDCLDGYVVADNQAQDIIDNNKVDCVIPFLKSKGVDVNDLRR